MTLLGLRTGWAFQIQDDLLNLDTTDWVCKERAGDL